ncbi:hypothetical protein [Mycobacterium kiyosense]|uniref:hypothetical protein n=1 Tax=Mycobacterium kiyosense TaxID=2871094 RepID=UPI00222F1F0A|nr:hypothetical protein [Mycobacterium kiyosense]GLC11008.1 hypothetical protein SRL2020411_56540 [Mycobacterium kiyosense]
MRWDQGRETVEALIADKRIEQVQPSLYVNLTQDHCDGLIRDHLGEEVVAQASS